MGWRDLLKPDIQDFIKTHRDSDVRALAFKKAPDASWPYALILDQIKVHQKAKVKAYNLYESDGFIFPNSDLFEQASSSACANYKTYMFENRGCFVDLTAGAGVDGFTISRGFHQSVFVERDEVSAQLLTHNAACFGDNIVVVCDDAVDYVREMDMCDAVFIDPQRRGNGRKGFFAFEDCSPNIVQLLPVLRRKTRKLIVKASPLIDIERGIVTLKHVSEVHVVQWQRECKEVLFVLDFQCDVAIDHVEIIAVDLDDDGGVRKRFSYQLKDEKKALIEYGMPEHYLYEPDPAFQKSGGFKSFAVRFGLTKIHPHTHLYTACDIIPDFPGRCVAVEKIVPVHRRFLDVRNADLKIRNFPSTVQSLRKKLHLKDGGDHRVYAATLSDNSKKLII